MGDGDGTRERAMTEGREQWQMEVSDGKGEKTMERKKKSMTERK
jgi:hypothetical protein